MGLGFGRTTMFLPPCQVCLAPFLVVKAQGSGVQDDHVHPEGETSRVGKAGSGLGGMHGQVRARGGALGHQ